MKKVNNEASMKEAVTNINRNLDRLDEIHKDNSDLLDLPIEFRKKITLQLEERTNHVKKRLDEMGRNFSSLCNGKACKAVRVRLNNARVRLRLVSGT